MKHNSPISKKSKRQLSAVGFESSIHTLRGERVILDADLAIIYGTTVKRLNQAVRRNVDRFPNDFRFQLTSNEWEPLNPLRSQNVTLKITRGRTRKYLPYAFTEHGAIMAANVLRSQRAIKMSVFVVRAFIKMRHVFSENQNLLEKLQLLEKTLTDRLDKHERAIAFVIREIQKLMEPPQVQKRRSIGFGRED